MIKIASRRKKEDDMDMTPLLDAVFILLIFFILAASFTVRGMDIDLPPAKSSQALSGRIVEIELFANGSFNCDGVAVSRTDLPYEVQKIVKSFKTRPGQLVLKSAPNAPVEALVFLVDTVRQHGGERLMVATSSFKKD